MRRDSGCRRRTVSALCISLLAAVACIAPLAAPAYPVKPVRFVVPFPPGGINDVISRSLGQKLAEGWGQQVLVDNRGGAGSIIGTDIVAKSAPDGHTLLLISTAHAINVSLHSKLPYDSVKDFAPVTMLASSPFVLVVHPSLPVRSVADLVAIARAKPGQLQYSSSGSGTVIHLMGEMLKAGAKIDVVHVPYKGVAPALTDLIAGQVQFSFGSHLTVGTHVKSGRVRALAVTTPTRSRVAPELPTIAEAGVPGYQATAWYGVLVAAGTPRDIVNKLNADITRVLNLPDIRDRLFGQGVEIVGSSPEQLAEHLRSETARWSTAVRQSGAKPD